MLLDTFRKMGAQGNSAETQKSSHNPRSKIEAKMEEVVPKMARQRELNAHPKEDA